MQGVRNRDVLAQETKPAQGERMCLCDKTQAESVYLTLTSIRHPSQTLVPMREAPLSAMIPLCRPCAVRGLAAAIEGPQQQAAAGACLQTGPCRPLLRVQQVA